MIKCVCKRENCKKRMWIDGYMLVLEDGENGKEYGIHLDPNSTVELIKELTKLMKDFCVEDL